MLFALLLAMLASSRGGGVEGWLSVLVFGVLSIIDFCAIPLERRRLARKTWGCPTSAGALSLRGKASACRGTGSAGRMVGG